MGYARESMIIDLAVNSTGVNYVFLIIWSL